MACTMALTPACSTQKSDAEQDSGALDSSSDAVMTGGPIWTAESQAIDVGCFGFFPGSERVRATREELSTDQLSILAALTLVPANKAQCVQDGISCSVAITAADGTVARYDSEQYDSGCNLTAPVIPYDSLTRFLQSVPCLSAKQGGGLSADGSVTAPSLTPDVRCYDGVFTAPPDTVKRLLMVDDPSVPRHLELDSCNDGRRSPALLHPQLLAPDGTTPLPVVWVAVLTDPGPDGTCYRADYTFPAAGAYVLSIDVDAGFTAGDFFVRFY